MPVAPPETIATLPASLPAILFAPSVPPISAQAMLSVMREAAKTVRAIGYCACERRETTAFQPVRPDCLCSGIGCIACAASMKNHDLSSLEKFIPAITRK
jgi:hypothetical protein